LPAIPRQLKDFTVRGLVAELARNRKRRLGTVHRKSDTPPFRNVKTGGNPFFAIQFKTMTLFSIVPPHLRREALGMYG
jgi:hypothetical protein